MSKYEPLTHFLAKSKRRTIELTFAEIERIIDDSLPASATQHRAFWSNNPVGHAHAKAWLAAGFESENVDIGEGRIVFRKTGADSTARDMTPAQRRKLGQERLAALFGCMKGTIHIPDDVDIMEPIELEWDAMKD